MDQIAIYLPGIILAYSAFFLSIMSPGPNILAILGTSMSVGRSAGIAIAAGVAAGSFCWASLTVAGLSALLAAYAWTLTVIKLVGGVYLLWLAYNAFRSAAASHELVATVMTGPTRRLGYFARGFIIQMTNPKAALAWIAIISLGLRPEAPWWVGSVIIVGTAALSLAIHGVYALAFSSPPMLRVYGQARRWIQVALGTFFCFAGLRLLNSRS
ncbi:MAG: LysE family translocator [Geminicoccaceae bacterium]